ncbi:MAG TPA: Gfo/Idh/MocA family oxidoreductase [Burkholderiaceae bacterium]|nr:Gfo/Idh/MocA family oxidoreductase [Burkholderiaceae bacterium]
MEHKMTLRKLRCAMVGGGRGALIGDVHRKAMAFDGQIELVSGALSSRADIARASGHDLGLRDDRIHTSWEGLLEHELSLPGHERIDLVCIVTPNHLHYDVAKQFVEAGVHVVCDKPLVHTSAQANDLVRSVARQKVVFGVTYNYTGYPMVREARAMVHAGAIGPIRKVIVEYNQGWLARPLETTGHKQAEWRTDPARSGVAGAMGDIGSHAENLVSTVTGLEIESLCADLTTFIPGRRLDDDGSVLLRFKGGARGVLLASQIEIGCENDLRLRVFGADGSLEWHQEDPNYLTHLPLDGPKKVITRGSPWLSEAARRAARIPPGHPEGFFEAFANVYRGVAADIHARIAGATPDPLAVDYPRVEDGARGVRFIERTVESARSERKWVAMT